jgi:hypothetical protein
MYLGRLINECDLTEQQGLLINGAQRAYQLIHTLQSPVAGTQHDPIAVNARKPLSGTHSWQEVLEMIKLLETEQTPEFRTFSLKAEFTLPKLTALVQLQADQKSVRASSKSDKGISFRFAAEKKKNIWVITEWKGPNDAAPTRITNLSLNFGSWLSKLQGDYAFY